MFTRSGKSLRGVSKANVRNASKPKRTNLKQKQNPKTKARQLQLQFTASPPPEIAGVSKINKTPIITGEEDYTLLNNNMCSKELGANVATEPAENDLSRVTELDPNISRRSCPDLMLAETENNFSSSPALLRQDFKLPDEKQACAEITPPDDPNDFDELKDLFANQSILTARMLLMLNEQRRDLLNLLQALCTRITELATKLTLSTGHSSTFKNTHTKNAATQTLFAPECHMNKITPKRMTQLQPNQIELSIRQTALNRGRWRSKDLARWSVSKLLRCDLHAVDLADITFLRSSHKWQNIKLTFDQSLIPKMLFKLTKLMNGFGIYMRRVFKEQQFKDDSLATGRRMLDAYVPYPGPDLQNSNEVVPNKETELSIDWQKMQYNDPQMREAFANLPSDDQLLVRNSLIQIIKDLTSNYTLPKGADNSQSKLSSSTALPLHRCNPERNMITKDVETSQDCLNAPSEDILEQELSNLHREDVILDDCENSREAGVISQPEQHEIVNLPNAKETTHGTETIDWTIFSNPLHFSETFFQKKKTQTTGESKTSMSPKTVQHPSSLFPVITVGNKINTEPQANKLSLQPEVQQRPLDRNKQPSNPAVNNLSDSICELSPCDSASTVMKSCQSLRTESTTPKDLLAAPTSMQEQKL